MHNEDYVSNEVCPECGENRYEYHIPKSGGAINYLCLNCKDRQLAACQQELSAFRSLPEKDTIDLREWLDTQSEDAIVAYISGIHHQLVTCQQELEAARGVIEEVRFHLKVHTNFPMAKALATYDTAKERKK
jgi:hypothetical protein